jgi:AraC-like DNA-binding protein
MIVVPPLEPHANRSPKAGVAYRNCLISAAFVDGVAQDLAGCPAAHLRLPILVTDPHGHGRMSALHRALGDGSSRLDLECRVLDACRWLIRQGGPHPSPSAIRSTSRLARAREALLDVPTANASLTELAAMADLSPFRFARLFKASFGMAPHAFQVQARVERAKCYIRDGLALAEAALQAGFADQSHLHRHFRRIVGLTPGQFQAEMGKNVQDRRF